mmetsp:Transcript_13045/g.23994  ORF Transcript_13045/g.23994 Transcript_13045/m.23994 type:complete len:238 (+) Transcript_13045:48-761(+)
MLLCKDTPNVLRSVVSARQCHRGPLTALQGAARSHKVAMPSGPTTVFFCRHGETDWNASHKLQGRSDIPLNSAGLEQAQCIANVLKGQDLAAVFSSPLMRAKHTAEAIATAIGSEVIVDPRLRERNLGIMEGRTGKEIQSEHPQVWEKWQCLEELPPEAQCEPEPEVVARVEDMLFSIAKEHPGQAVALVSHGGVLRCLCKRTFGNASISTLQVDGRTWQSLRLDDASHLTNPGLPV